MTGTPDSGSSGVAEPVDGTHEPRAGLPARAREPALGWGAQVQRLVREHPTSALVAGLVIGVGLARAARHA
jgi:hypothetical protein